MCPVLKLDPQHQRRYKLRNESGTYTPNGRFTYEVACELAHQMRHKLSDDTIGVVDVTINRFVSEILR